MDKPEFIYKYLRRKKKEIDISQCLEQIDLRGIKDLAHAWQLYTMASPRSLEHEMLWNIYVIFRDHSADMKRQRLQ